MRWMMENSWRSVDDELPAAGTAVWYFFDVVGVWQGRYDGLLEDMPVFTSKCGNYWLTGDVTHWMPDVGQEEPEEPDNV